MAPRLALTFSRARAPWFGAVNALAGLLIALGSLALPQAAQAATGSGGIYLAPRAATAAPTGFAALCHRYQWLCSASGGTAPLGAGWIARATALNSHVNHTVPEIEDIAQYGRADVWALPTARGGDCEDIAMLKKLLLMREGVPGRDLRIATVLDHNRENHAVLVMRTDQGDLVLDNLTDRILPWHATGYTFLTIQSEAQPAKWVSLLRGGLMDTRVARN